jgi:D-aminopeptidase
MRVMIATSMEGVSGVFDLEQINAGASDCERPRRWFTHDAMALPRDRPQ